MSRKMLPPGMDTDRTGPPVASGWRFRTPPGWPEPPAGWRPAPGWAPDPHWPPAPPGWQFWEPDTEHPGQYGPPPQAQPVHPSAAHGAGQPQPIGNWAARPRQKQDKEAEKEQKQAEKEQKRAENEQRRAAANDESATKLDGKARQRATKKGLDVDGALVVAHNINKDSAYETLIVWPDRVEKHNHRKLGSLFVSGKGVESMLIGNIASVEARNDGIYGKLDVHGSGNSISFRTSQPEAHKIRAIVMDLMQTSRSPVSSAAPSLSPAEQIKQLGELRDAGLLSDEEFNAKKKELLDRM